MSISRSPESPQRTAVPAGGFSFDAYVPREIARRVCDLGVAKARTPVLSLVMLGMLAGGFIGLGALFLAMAWAERKVTTRDVLFNWVVVCAANFAGAVGLAAVVLLSGHTGNDGGAIARTYVGLAAAKTALPAWNAFFSGVMCNVLVCTAVWMAMAGRSVTDKLVAIVLPISAFVAAGFEHSIANMYVIPLGMMLQWQAGEPVRLAGLAHNLVPVIAGNLVGGSVLVALVYHVIYVRPRRKVQS